MIADVVTVDGTTVLASVADIEELHLVNGATLTHEPTTGAAASSLVLTVGTLTIDDTSSIDVSGRGYVGGVYTTPARTLGNGVYLA